MLDIKKDPKIDLHFYVPESTKRDLDRICSAHEASRGRVLTALVQLYWEEHADEAQ